jgi:hypothetical protein
MKSMGHASYISHKYMLMYTMEMVCSCLSRDSSSADTLRIWLTTREFKAPISRTWRAVLVRKQRVHRPVSHSNATRDTLSQHWLSQMNKKIGIQVPQVT